MHFIVLKITPALENLLSQVPELSPEIKAGKQWDPKVGFTIPYSPYASYFFLTCQTNVNGYKVSSQFIPIRQSESMFFF